MQDSLAAFRDQRDTPKKYHEAVETVCPVCYEEFDDHSTIPRSMQYCSHLVCHRCVIQMAGPSQERPIGRNRSVVKCPICKQKGRPLLAEGVQPGDRVALALVDAVKEIECLGKRLKTETQGLSFAKVSHILRQAHLAEVESHYMVLPGPAKVEGSPRLDGLDQFRETEAPLEVIRCSEARTEEKVQWSWKRPLTTKPRLEVIISLDSGCIKVIRHM